MNKWNPLESCFAFDRKMPEGNTILFLHNIRFYFMVAGFTYFSLLSEVDKQLDHSPCIEKQVGQFEDILILPRFYMAQS